MKILRVISIFQSFHNYVTSCFETGNFLISISRNETR